MIDTYHLIYIIKISFDLIFDSKIHALLSLRQCWFVVHARTQFLAAFGSWSLILNEFSNKRTYSIDWKHIWPIIQRFIMARKLCIRMVNILNLLSILKRLMLLILNRFSRILIYHKFRRIPNLLINYYKWLFRVWRSSQFSCILTPHFWSCTNTLICT